MKWMGMSESRSSSTKIPLKLIFIALKFRLRFLYEMGWNSINSASGHYKSFGFDHFLWKVHINIIQQNCYFDYCHTRPGGKTYPIPKGSKDGPKSWYYIHQWPASQPASQPPGPPIFSEYSKWNISSIHNPIFLKF